MSTKDGACINHRSTYKTMLVQARVSPDEKKALELVAERERRKPSEMLRELIRAAAKECGLWPPEKKEQ
jgi:hypothetical protein